MVAPISINELRTNTLRTLTDLATWHRLWLPADIKMNEITDSKGITFRSLVLTIPAGERMRRQVDEWAGLLGLPRPKLKQYHRGQPGAHNCYESWAHADEGVWLAWQFVRVDLRWRVSNQ